MNRHSISLAALLKREARDNADWPAVLVAVIVLVLMATGAIK